MDFLPRRQSLGKVSAGLSRSRRRLLRIAAQDGSPTDDGQDGPLTEVQIGILSARATGKTRKEIAYSLGLSLKTVEYHFARIYRYLDVSNDIELTHYALRCGLVQLKQFPANRLRQSQRKARPKKKVR